MLGKIWTFLNGKKLVIGSVITVVASIVATLPVILPLVVSDANTVAHAVGVGVTVLGLLHKVYKFIYKEELAS